MTSATPLPPADALTGSDRVLPVAIIGGGISGLALAAWLAQEGIEAVVIEKGARPGGVIGSVEKDGFIFERGPNTILERTETLEALLRLAGIAVEAQRSPLRGQKRYVWHGGRLHEVPAGPGSLLATKLLSTGAKLRLLREPWIAPVERDEPLKDFVIRRLGSEVYERLFLPMVQGIWAGDPALMSTEASFPLLKELERGSGSLIRGFIRKMREGGRKLSPSMVSFAGGLEKLPRALAAGMGGRYWSNAEVRELTPRRDSGNFQIIVEREGLTKELEANCVFVCTGAHPAAQLIESMEPALAARFRQIHYSPLASVGLGLRADSVRIPPGFGFLSARDQGLRVLGAIFNSNFLQGRAPAGCLTLTAMLGGDLDPRAAELDDAALINIVRNDLGRALGWNGRYEAIHIERWRGAIPRYALDHSELVNAVRETEARSPELRFLANWHGGTSIGDRIELAGAAARSLAAARRKEPSAARP